MRAWSVAWLVACFCLMAAGCDTKGDYGCESYCAYNIRCVAWALDGGVDGGQAATGADAGVDGGLVSACTNACRQIRYGQSTACQKASTALGTCLETASCTGTPCQQENSAVMTECGGAPPL